MQELWNNGGNIVQLEKVLYNGIQWHKMFVSEQKIIQNKIYKKKEEIEDRVENL